VQTHHLADAVKHGQLCTPSPPFLATGDNGGFNQIIIIIDTFKSLYLALALYLAVSVKNPDTGEWF